MDTLEREYARLDELYRNLAGDPDALSNLDRIRDVNQQLSSVLDKMLTALAQTKQESSNIQTYKDELIRRLQKIRSDYDGLKKNTDQLETLRRIREYESAKAAGSLNWYLLGFLVLCGILILFMFIFGRRQSFDATAAIPTNPTMSAPFM